MKKLLLISNSTMSGKPFLEYTLPYLDKFLNDKKKNLIFIPYAAVTFTYNEYENKVNKALNKIGKKVISLHHLKDVNSAIKNAETIIVGGGNTWKLLREMQGNDLIKIIKEKVNNGVPYIGWSAGANLACPTIKTTNDMPITEPKNFNALDLISFQINPHYVDYNIKNHAGETREDRINEFIEMNKETPVVGLREGTMLWIENNEILLYGDKPCRLFSYKQPTKEIKKKLNLN